MKTKVREKTNDWIHQSHRDLAQVEREYSMGEMATALAHELNQPLAAIVSYLQGSIRYLKNKNCKKSDLVIIMQRAITQTMRAGKIIHRMKESMPKSKLSRVKTDINETVKETLLLVEHDIKKYHATIKIELGELLPSLYIDHMQIKQAFVSIIRNLLQAMKIAKILAPCVTIKSIVNKNAEIEVFIIDNRSNFSTLNSPVLFEPYFTAKKRDRGFGLSIARTIIHAHGGTLKAYPVVGDGACFRCILPIKKEYEK